MVLIQATVLGKIFCGSIHIRNKDASHPQHPEMGYYEVVCYDEYGEQEWTADMVEHRRSDPWYVLLGKCFVARITDSNKEPQ